MSCDMASGSFLLPGIGPGWGLGLRPQNLQIEIILSVCCAGADPGNFGDTSWFCILPKYHILVTVMFTFLKLDPKGTAISTA